MYRFLVILVFVVPVILGDFSHFVERGLRLAASDTLTPPGMLQMGQQCGRAAGNLTPVIADTDRIAVEGLDQTQTELTEQHLFQALSTIPLRLQALFFASGGRIEVNPAASQKCTEVSGQNIDACWYREEGANVFLIDPEFLESTGESVPEGLHYALQRFFGFYFSEEVLALGYDSALSSPQLVLNDSLSQNHLLLGQDLVRSYLADTNQSLTEQELQTPDQNTLNTILSGAFGGYYCNDSSRATLQQWYPQTFEMMNRIDSRLAISAALLPWVSNSEIIDVDSGQRQPIDAYLPYPSGYYNGPAFTTESTIRFQENAAIAATNPVSFLLPTEMILADLESLFRDLDQALGGFSPGGDTIQGPMSYKLVPIDLSDLFAVDRQNLLEDRFMAGLVYPSSNQLDDEMDSFEKQEEATTDSVVDNSTGTDKVKRGTAIIKKRGGCAVVFGGPQQAYADILVAFLLFIVPFMSIFKASNFRKEVRKQDAGLYIED